MGPVAAREEEEEEEKEEGEEAEAEGEVTGRVGLPEGRDTGRDRIDAGVSGCNAWATVGDADCVTAPVCCFVALPALPPAAAVCPCFPCCVC